MLRFEQAMSTRAVVFRVIKQKFLPTSDILRFERRKRSPKFVWCCENLIFAAVQSNKRLFAFGRKFKWKKNQPIRLRYSNSYIPIGRGDRSVPHRNFFAALRTVRKHCKAVAEMTASTLVQLNEINVG